jgi:hypothetical protein
VAECTFNHRFFLREVNERIREVNTVLGAKGSNYQLFCECQRGCLERIDVPAEVYARAREADRFIVAEGHEQPAGEQVVAEGPSYLVVESEPAELIALPAA